MKRNSFSYVILSICLALVSCEFYSSVHEITKLVNYERILLGKMEKFITLNENKLDYLKEMLSEFEKEREDALEIGEQYFENPINKYLLTKRLSADWEKLENFLDHEVGTSVLKSIDKLRTNYTFRGEEDFNSVMEGILRLQKFYRLNAKDIAQGIVGGVEYTMELTARDCNDLGKFALKENELLAAHAWLTEALERFESYKPTIVDAKLEKQDILESMAEARFKLSDFNGAAEMSYSLTLLRPDDLRLAELHNNYTQHATTEPSHKVEGEHEPIPSDFNTVDEATGFRYTCTGHIHQLPHHEHDLFCGYITHTHPFLLIAPIKAEEIHLDPLILIYHEVIYESEIEKVLEIANDKIEETLATNGSKVSYGRNSQFAYIPKDQDKVLKTIDQRVADMTGLNMDTAEQYLVANYGVGGYYGQHFDFFEKNNEKLADLGNRMATVLFYLTDVEEGGGTAFQFINKLIEPRKGSAAFWYNLHTSGDGDAWTKHGSCPILVGSKWVISRWIRERGQEFKRPCDLYSDSIETSIML